MAATETHQAIETVFRIEQARLIAGLAHVARDVSLAEELAQDALVIALSEWPKTLVPNNPGAGPMAAALRNYASLPAAKEISLDAHEDDPKPPPRPANVRLPG